MQSLLVFMFVFILLGGILISLFYRKRKKIVVASTLIMMAVNIPILLIMASMHNDTLNKEIENVIRARNGEIIEVVKMNEDSERTPFKEQTGRSNIIFKVTYKVRDEVFVAWYRAVKTLNDIHDQKDEKRVRGYGEMWIFESDEMSEWSSEK